MKKFKTVHEYMAEVPEAARRRLDELRKAILQAEPKAEEGISYNIPVVRRNGEIVVWYAGFKKHVSLFPKAAAIAAFKEELTAYKTSKGAVQFPIEKPIPVALVKKIVKFRIKEIADDAKA